MAYRRSLSNRANLLTKRFNPCLGYVTHDDERKTHPTAADSCRPKSNSFLHRGYHNYNINKATTGLSTLFRESCMSPFSLPMGFGSSVCRYSSATAVEGSDKVESLSDMAENVVDNGMELAASQVSVVSEVATAAADSFYPIAALQYFIDGVHTFTGLNWWASIVLTTVLIRGLTIPILINQLKCTTKLTLMRPRLEEIKQEMEDKKMDIIEGQRRMKELFKESGVTPFAPLKGLFIQGPIFISFYLAITNMVEKVPSFKEGGALSFTDLTTPYSLYILPVLTGLTFLVTVECNVQEGLEGNPIAKTIKKFSRGLAVLTVPFTMGFPKAIFCYWVTSNMFSLIYGLIIKRPQVKQLLNIPLISDAPTSTAQPALNLFSTSTPSKSMTDETSVSSEDISQRLQTLENKVKGKNKNKKNKVQ